MGGGGAEGRVEGCRGGPGTVEAKATGQAGKSAAVRSAARGLQRAGVPAPPGGVQEANPQDRDPGRVACALRASAAASAASAGL